MLPVFRLDQEFQSKQVQNQLVRTRAHDTVYGAYTYEYKIEEGMLYLSVLNRKLHEITYECPSILPWVRKRRMEFLMQAYSNRGSWRQVSKSTSGSIFQSADDQWFASCNREATVTSFGTMFFYEEKYRLVT